MTDEIKESYIKLFKYVNDKYETYTIVDENTKAIKALLDYITNLQEKVNQYENPDDMTLMFMWCNEKAKDKIKELQEDLDYQKEMYLEYCDKHTKLIQKYNNLQEENERLNNELGALLIDKYGVSNLNIDKNGNFKGTIKTKEYYKLNNIIEELDKLIEQYSKNDYYYKYNGKYLKSEIINDLKELKEGK